MRHAGISYSLISRIRQNSSYMSFHVENTLNSNVHTVIYNDHIFLHQGTTRKSLSYGLIRLKKISEQLKPKRCVNSCFEWIQKVMTRVILARNDVLTPFDLRVQIFRVNVEFSTCYRGQKNYFEKISERNLPTWKKKYFKKHIF